MWEGSCSVGAGAGACQRAPFKSIRPDKNALGFCRFPPLTLDVRRMEGTLTASRWARFLVDSEILRTSSPNRFPSRGLA